MQEVVNISTTPTHISGDIKAPMGGAVFLEGPIDWLGLKVILQVSRKDGEEVSYVYAGEATKPCSLSIPWGSKRVRFVTLTGPNGALQAPVAYFDIRS